MNEQIPRDEGKTQVSHKHFQYHKVKGFISQILRRYTENQSITLQIDNAQMAAEDFRSK